MSEPETPDMPPADAPEEVTEYQVVTIKHHGTGTGEHQHSSARMTADEAIAYLANPDTAA